MGKQDYLDHLAEVPLFAACTKRDLKLLARRAENVTVKAGTELVREGQPGHEFFVIAQGQATVKRAGRKIAALKPGDFFGELALLDRAPRNATIVADTEMELFVLGQREFAGVIDEVPGLGHKLLAGMARRLREGDARSVQ